MSHTLKKLGLFVEKTYSLDVSPMDFERHLRMAVRRSTSEPSFGMIADSFTQSNKPFAGRISDTSFRIRKTKTWFDTNSSLVQGTYKKENRQLKIELSINGLGILWKINVVLFMIIFCIVLLLYITEGILLLFDDHLDVDYFLSALLPFAIVMVCATLFFLKFKSGVREILEDLELLFSIIEKTYKINKQ